MGCANFSIKVESNRKGFSKSQLERWVREIHGPDARIDIEEVED